MKELAKEINFDFIACLGDITEGDTTQEITSDRNAHIINGFTQLGVPYYQVIGNHDDNRYGDATFTHEQLYENYLSTITDVVFDTSSMHKTNYYKDFDDLGIRCIFLNSNTNGAYGYSNETCDWFEEAIKTENGIIVFTHIPPVPAQNYGAKYGTDKGSTRIREACANADNFLIMFSGHNHYDSVFTEPFLSYTMNCQKFENENGDPSLWAEGAVKPQRVAGTESEDCFDIVVVRPESGRIDLVRFGAGEDRSFFIESLHTHIYENGICTICGSAQPGPVITGQPESVSADRFAEAVVSVAAEGEGLTYAWFYRCVGETEFRTSACTGDTFRIVMSGDLHGCEAYCVITDGDGNTVTSDTAILTLTGEEAPAARIPGDLNGDGTVNNKDLTALFRYLSGWDVVLH